MEVGSGLSWLALQLPATLEVEWKAQGGQGAVLSLSQH